MGGVLEPCRCYTVPADRADVFEQLQRRCGRHAVAVRLAGYASTGPRLSIRASGCGFDGYRPLLSKCGPCGLGAPPRARQNHPRNAASPEPETRTPLALRTFNYATLTRGIVQASPPSASPFGGHLARRYLSRPLGGRQ